MEIHINCLSENVYINVCVTVNEFIALGLCWGFSDQTILAMQNLIFQCNIVIDLTFTHHDWYDSQISTLLYSYYFGSMKK